MPSTNVWLLRSEARYRAVLCLSLLLFLAQLAVIAVFFLVSFISPTKAIATPKQHLVAGLAKDYSTAQPVYFSTGDFWLVKQPDGSFRALIARDTRSRFIDGRYAGCPVRWLPDFVVGVVGNPQMQEKGWFKANCTGSDFRRDGSRAFGPSSRDLDRRPTYVSSDGHVIVNIDDNRILLGKDWSTP